MLQRGRVLSGAETVHSQSDHGGISIASTGPRPFGRGNRHGYIGIIDFRGASTGPRPFGRGNLMKKSLDEIKQELASTGPRPFGRGNTLSPLKRKPRCFCASTGPRPFGRGNWGEFSALDAIMGFNGAASFRARKRQPAKSEPI